jgi:betaine lipid synthase
MSYNMLHMFLDMLLNINIPYSFPHSSLLFYILSVFVLFVVALNTNKRMNLPLPNYVKDYLRFAYNCFLKAHDGDQTRDQKAALESFYKTQATAYDRTRTNLLQGREDMLALVAAQLQHRMKTGKISKKPIWVDVSCTS